MRRLTISSLLLLCCACSGRQAPPGVVLGEFDFSASEGSGDCGLVDVPSRAFAFTGILSQQPETGASWLTVEGRVRPASRDGQRFSSTFERFRRFPECACDSVPVEETVRLVLLDDAQLEASGGQCPPDALAGGVSLLEGEEGLALAASARRACGELELAVRPGPTRPPLCVCPPCGQRHALAGLRQ